MNNNNVLNPLDQAGFNTLFSMDWLLGRDRMARLLPRRWDRFHQRIGTAARDRIFESKNACVMVSVEDVRLRLVPLVDVCHIRRFLEGGV